MVYPNNLKFKFVKERYFLEPLLRIGIMMPLDSHLLRRLVTNFSSQLFPFNVGSKQLSKVIISNITRVNIFVRAVMVFDDSSTFSYSIKKFYVMSSDVTIFCFVFSSQKNIGIRVRGPITKKITILYKSRDGLFPN